MKKTYKTILCIAVMLFAVCAAGLTVWHAGKNQVSKSAGMQEPGRTFSNMQEQEASDGNSPDLRDDMQQFMPGDAQGDMPGDAQGDMPGGIQGDMLGGQGDMPGGRKKQTLDAGHIALLGLCSAFFSLALLYLLMSRKNERFYQNKDKAAIYLLASIILIAALTTGTTLLANQLLPSGGGMQQLESAKREKTTLDQSNIANQGEIDLSEISTDLTISSGGSYVLSGAFSRSIIIDAQEADVSLVLAGVSIESQNAPAIVGLSAGKITITSQKGTENTLSDSGNSEYDACIFSNAELEFDGEGTLTVNGTQNEGKGIATEAQNITIQSGTYRITSSDDGINAGGDGATITLNGGTIYIDASGDGIDSNQDAVINGGTVFVMGSDTGGDSGIDTETGYTINGGLVVALGSDMIEAPKAQSQQRSIALTLDETVEKGTLITLMRGDEAILSFDAEKNFRTLILSSDALEEGTYSLYAGGSHTGEKQGGIYYGGEYTKGNAAVLRAAGQESFAVAGSVSLFGVR